MGAPINNHVIHSSCGASMINKDWRRYREVNLEAKWGFVAAFNVMQYFFYNCSQSFVDDAKKQKAI